MTSAPWVRIVPLAPEHDITHFVSGLETADSWVRKHAHTERRVGVHVCLTPRAEVVAFYALKHIIVNLTGASRTMRNTEEADGATTGLLLAQMGVSQECQGNGAGTELMRHVLREAARLHIGAPFQLLVVDAATIRLKSFYGKFGFTSLAGGESRMVIRMSVVRRTFAT